MDEFNFLTGRDNPYLSDFEGMQVHRGIIPSLSQLKKLAKDEINAELKIISSFRDFDRQLQIFNNKATGRRPIYNDNEEIIDIENLADSELLFAILRFSALPGASRHHWGTDIDIYDAAHISKDAVQLRPSECVGDGPCAKLHQWLDEKIKDGNSLGFYRPYAEDRGGVSPENWHLSYAPLSCEFTEKYTIDFFVKNIEQAPIELKNCVHINAEKIFSQYISNINNY